VTTYASGGSLRSRITQRQGNPFPLEEALGILTQIGEALAYTHQKHILHRDLKPENILFTAHNEVLLADFGIAVITEMASTRQVAPEGTPYYMAPEQFEGMISAKSDQYALGCIAYELVTGRKPFCVPYPNIEAIWYHHAKVRPIAPTQCNPQVPLHVDQAILQALAKHRLDRHRDIHSFLAALHTPQLASPRAVQEEKVIQNKSQGEILPNSIMCLAMARKQGYVLFETKKVLNAYFLDGYTRTNPWIYALKKSKGALLVIEVNWDNALTFWAQWQIMWLRLHLTRSGTFPGGIWSAHTCHLNCDEWEHAERGCQMLKAIFWQDQGVEIPFPSWDSFLSRNPIRAQINEARAHGYIKIIGYYNRLSGIWHDFCILHRWPSIQIHEVNKGRGYPVILLPKGDTFLDWQKEQIRQFASTTVWKEKKEKDLDDHEPSFALSDNQVVFSKYPLPVQNGPLLIAEQVVDLLRRDDRFFGSDCLPQFKTRPALAKFRNVFSWLAPF
jgi:hypothetical protein